MRDRLVPIKEYALTVHRPVVYEHDPNNPERRASETLRSSTPIPIPRVGDEINRAAFFNEHRGAQPKAVVTRVEHSVQEATDHIVYTVIVYTEER